MTNTVFVVTDESIFGIYQSRGTEVKTKGNKIEPRKPEKKPKW